MQTSSDIVQQSHPRISLFFPQVKFLRSYTVSLGFELQPILKECYHILMTLDKALAFLLSKDVYVDTKVRKAIKLVLFSTIAIEISQILPIVPRTIYTTIYLTLDSFYDLLPVHRIQIELTLNSFLTVLGALIVSTILALISEKSVMIRFFKYLMSLVILILITHLIIWLVIQPACISGCRGERGWNDGQNIVSFIIFLLLPFIHFLIYLFTRFFFKSNSPSIWKKALIEWSFLYSSIFILMFSARIIEVYLQEIQVFIGWF